MNPPVISSGESKKCKKSTTCKNNKSSNKSTDKSTDSSKDKRKCSKHCKSKNCKYCAILSEAPQYLGVQFLVGNDITTKQLTSSQINVKTLMVDKLIQNNKTERYNVREWLDAQNGILVSDTSQKKTFSIPIYQNILELVAKPLINNSSDQLINVTTLLSINVMSDNNIIKSTIVDKYQDILPPYQDMTIRILYKGPFPAEYLTMEADKTTYLTLSINPGEIINQGIEDLYISFQN